MEETNVKKDEKSVADTLKEELFFKGKNAFNRTRNFEFTIFVNYRHRIVEVCGMSHTSIVAGHHVLISGARVGNGR